MKFNEILKELREEKGISQNKLSKEIGLSSGAISRLENLCERVPSIETIIKLADYFKVTVGQMVGTEPL